MAGHDSKPGHIAVGGQPYTFRVASEDGRQYFELLGSNHHSLISLVPYEVQSQVKALGAHLDQGERLTTQEARLVSSMIRATRDGPLGP